MTALFSALVQWWRLSSQQWRNQWLRQRLRRQRGQQLRQQAFSQTPWLAIDLELTGLDAKSEQIVSIGWIAGTGWQMDYHSARHYYHRDVCDLKQSPTVHGVTASQLAQGLPMLAILQALNQVGQDRVWLFHHAPLDCAFLQRAAEQHQLTLSALATLDTMAIERQRLSKAMQAQGSLAIAQDALQLMRCRERYHLPKYHGHNALGDAIACAELLQAQALSFTVNPHVLPTLQQLGLRIGY